MTKLKIILIILAVILCGIGVFYFTSSDVAPHQKEETKTKRVEAQSVSQLQGQEENIIAYGQVVSVTGVDVVPELGGLVKGVYKRLGNVVRPGDVVIELQNATQAQAVAQARASVASAKASLAQVSGDAGAETIAQAQSTIASQKSALAATQQQTLSSLDGLYTGLSGVLKSQIDRLFFSNTNTDFPDLKFDGTTQVSEEALEQKRAQLNVSLEEGRNYNNVDRALTQFGEKVREVQSLVRALSSEIDGLQAGGGLSLNTIEGWEADLALVNSSLSSYISQQTALEAALGERRQALNSAQVTLSELYNGADEEDIAVARAGVTSAEANLQSAVIAYNKTRITAPVLGKISSMDVKIGNLVGSGAPVFTIANENTLRIDTQVTSTEAARISVGESVIIDNEHQAYVSVVAPSVNETTGKISVQILLDDQNIRLGSGIGVGIVFSPEKTESNTVTQMQIPIEAVFVRGQSSYVYVLDENKAVAREIVTPSLFGKNVTVTQGLMLDDIIVLSARGVKDNETVEVINSQ